MVLLFSLAPPSSVEAADSSARRDDKDYSQNQLRRQATISNADFLSDADCGATLVGRTSVETCGNKVESDGYFLDVKAQILDRCGPRDGGPSDSTGVCCLIHGGKECDKCVDCDAPQVVNEVCCPRDSCPSGKKCCKSVDDYSIFCCIDEDEDCLAESCPIGDICGDKVSDSGHILDENAEPGDRCTPRDQGPSDSKGVCCLIGSDFECDKCIDCEAPQVVNDVCCPNDKCEEGYKCCKSEDDISKFCCIPSGNDCNADSCDVPSPSVCGHKVDSSGHVLDVGAMLGDRCNPRDQGSSDSKGVCCLIHGI